MNKTFKLNSDITVDLPKLIDSRLLVQANSGGGKSWLLRRILEQSHGKVQQIVIDLEGEFSTLREKYDFILAGKNGDTPADPRSAGLLARKLLELNVSAIIDLYELDHNERKRFVRLFLEAMVNAPKELWHPCLVVIDEAHVFCPEKGQAESSDAVINLATRGRKRGYAVLLATQRLSKLHKDAAAECNNKLIGRTGLDVDMKRASDELGFNTKEQYLSLRNLESGEFFAFGNAISQEVIKIKIGEVQTSHPKAGSRFTVKTIPPTAKIKTLLPKLSDLPEEAKKEAVTISDLQAEIRNLTRENSSLKRSPGVTKPEEIEKLVNAELKRHQIAFGSVENGYKQVVKNWQKYSGDLLWMIEHLFKTASKAQMPSTEPGAKYVATEIKLPAKPKQTIYEKGFSVDRPIVVSAITDINTEVKISGGALRMLKVLVSRYPMQLTKAQLATFSKLKSSSGTYGTYLSTLRSAGLITDNGELFKATQQGIDYIGESPEPPQTAEDVLQMWKDNLSGGAKRMFEALEQVYPQGYSKEELGGATDLISTSGTFGTYLSILRSNGLIDQQGNQIKLSDNLYI